MVFGEVSLCVANKRKQRQHSDGHDGDETSRIGDPLSNLQAKVGYEHQSGHNRDGRTEEGAAVGGDP